MDENEELEQQVRREVQSDWRAMRITRIGELNDRRVGSLNLVELERVERRWMPQIRTRWFEIDMEVKRHYFALEAALQSPRSNLQIPPGEATASQQQPKSVSDVRESEDDSSAEEALHEQEVAAPTAEEVELPEEDLAPQKEQPAEPGPEESQAYQRVPLKEIIGKYGIESVHWAADLLPMTSDDEFAIICADVEAKGFLHSVKIDDENVLIDGRTRLQVAWAVSLDPPIERIKTSDVLGYVLSENVARRHLTTGQKADIADKIANMRQGERTDLKPSQDFGKVSQEEAAKRLGTTSEAIRKIGIIKEYAPDELEEVRAGDLALDRAFKKANARKREADGQKKPAKRKTKHETAELPESTKVDLESVTASREDCVKALFILIEVLANSGEESFDAAFLESQKLDLGKYHTARMKLTKLVASIDAFSKAKHERNTDTSN